MKRVTFYDPLYDFVSFDEAEGLRARGIFDAGFSAKPVRRVSKSLLPFLLTPEFNRLSFLRQGDLSFLVYPSATHTRFAHAVGCCYLGYLAAREIVVTVRRRGTKQRHLYLSKWLEEKGWKEEFMLALLLHDVGHFAFSHALENDKDLWNALAIDVNHEDVACEFIEGRGELIDAFWRRQGKSKGYSSIAQVIQDCRDIDANIAEFLISAKTSLIEGRKEEERAAVFVLHELTSGLLDLDRIDHYRRDSYFSGMKFASNLNFASLLNGFSISYDAQDAAGRHEVRLSKEAIGHALTLLHSKERLVHDCFENVENLAYEVMLHQAFNYFCFGDDFYKPEWRSEQGRESLRESIFELLMTTDEELLLQMAAQGTQKVKDIVSRIRNRRPYHFVGRRADVQRHAMEIAQLRSEIARIAGTTHDEVVVRLGKGYGRSRAQRGQEWLQLDALNDENGFPLNEHEEYRRQIEHFKKMQEDTRNLFWIFTPTEDPEIQNRLRVALNSLPPRPT